MDAKSVGQAGLQGWRAKVADAVAAPVARRSGLADDQVRAAIGALFLALSVLYVVNAVRQLAGAR
ncbi:MAG: hypothetical protein AVDCRST_MAG52-3183 [uncultured Blastococcus sp.]|uniref:Uncharacterized protein n=1 Tax=uncultured Blastococcus sp. TaxID=217144 RepID=A0A6J4J4U6_9ACTN|nr:MAG: hypothetical protein AVDCRST_MAG52-3183 [uncultured Blastococcus sp.]